MKKILNPYLNKEGYNCVCCAPNNPVGLHLEFWEEGEDVLTIWNPARITRAGSIPCMAESSVC